MSLLSRLQKKFGRLAIPNLTVILIAGQVFVYVAYQLAAPRGGNNPLAGILFLPEKVVQGEIWRVVTFLFDPPVGTGLDGLTLVFSFFFWYLFYMMGTTLEVTWGTFRYNVFLLVGYLATVVAVMGCYFATGTGLASNGFLQASVFLAFARLHPDFTIMLLFVIPVKIKWLARFQWVLYALLVVVGDWMTRTVIVASILNVLLFFGRDMWRDMREGHRRMRRQARTLRTPARIVHKCRVCGLTSDQSPQTQFRYCSKCDGECCYCPEHLHNHEHVVSRESQELRVKSREPEVI